MTHVDNPVRATTFLEEITKFSCSSKTSKVNHLSSLQLNWW